MLITEAGLDSWPAGTEAGLDSGPAGTMEPVGTLVLMTETGLDFELTGTAEPVGTLVLMTETGPGAVGRLLLLTGQMVVLWYQVSIYVQSLCSKTNSQQGKGCILPHRQC